MSKNPEKLDAKNVFGGGTSPSFDDLWNRAEQSILTLWKEYGSEYLKRAKKSHSIPYLIPRSREQYATHDKFLKGTGLVLKSGRSTKGVWAGEVDRAYLLVKKKLMEAKIDQLTRQIKDQPVPKRTMKLCALHDMLPIRMSNYDVFKPLLLDAFMQNYDGHPEQCKHIQTAAKGRANLRNDLKQRGQTRSALLKEIKKDFNNATLSFAKENSKVLGEN